MNVQQKDRNFGLCLAYILVTMTIPRGTYLPIFVCLSCLISSVITASTAISVCFGVIRPPVVMSCLPMSSVTAVVPLRLRSRLVLSWLLVCSTSNYRDAGPLIEREIYYVIKVHEVLQDKINTPETSAKILRERGEEQCRVTGPSCA